MNKLCKVIKNVFPIPDIEHRKNIVIPINKVFPGFLLKRDWDYLCYLLFLTMFSLSLFVTALIFADILFDLKLFISKENFENDRTLLFSKSSQILGPSGGVLTLIFYLRIRLTIDLQNTKIPYMVGPRHLGNADKMKWFFTFLTLFLTSISMIFGSHLPPIILAKHYELQDSLDFILILQVFLIFGPSLGAALWVNSLLILEKILRWFPYFEGDYKLMKKVPREEW